MNFKSLPKTSYRDKLGIWLGSVEIYIPTVSHAAGEFAAQKTVLLSSNFNIVSLLWRRKRQTNANIGKCFDNRTSICRVYFRERRKFVFFQLNLFAPYYWRLLYLDAGSFFPVLPTQPSRLFSWQLAVVRLQWLIKCPLNAQMLWLLVGQVPEHHLAFANTLSLQGMQERIKPRSVTLPVQLKQQYFVYSITNLSMSKADSMTLVSIWKSA